jgi:exopolysaccharide biosynthesis polyprenyl glycosylphosphotransferase
MSAHVSEGIYPRNVADPIFDGIRPRTPKNTTKETVEALLLGAADFALVWLSAVVTLYFRIDAGDINYGSMLAKDAGSLILLSILIVLFCNAQKLYESTPRFVSDEISAVLKAVGLAATVLSASLYLSRQQVVSRIALGITVLLSAVLLVTWRYARRRRIAKLVAAGQDCRNVLVLGWSPQAELLDRHFVQHQLPGYVVKGFLDRRRPGSPSITGTNQERNKNLKALGYIDELKDIVRANFIDEILVFLPEDRDVVKQLIAESQRCGIGLRIVPDSYDGLAWGAPIQNLGPFPAIQVHERHIPVLGLVLKRSLDIVASALGLLLSFPLCVLIAIAIRLNSRGPILYSSERVGKKGTIFTCYKFRTMVQNADALKEGLRELNQRSKVLFKIENDPRITRVGRFLRKYSLDEVPQLWNVFRGDMSMVGPRPPIPGEYEQYELSHLKRLDVSPGITGLWQVEARKNPSFESYINLDTRYVDHWSVWLDLKILFKTVGVVFAGTGQ